MVGKPLLFYQGVFFFVYFTPRCKLFFYPRLSRGLSLIRSTPTPRVDGRRGAFTSCLAADADGQNVYLWLTACGPRAVLATYFGDSDREAAVCEKIVRSMRPI